MVQSALIRLRDAQCVAVVAVEHHMEVVRSVATSVTALATGMVLASGAPDEVLDSEVLQSAFIAPPKSAGGGAHPAPEATPEMR
jgi:branched-chain amino acid transport system ATP-binding protein